MDILTVLIVLALLATCATLGLGVLAMSGGTEVDKEFSTRLMWTRVGLQVATLVLLGVAVALR